MFAAHLLRSALALAAFAAGPVAAQDLPAPEGEPILTVTGAIGVTNDGDAAVFDRAMLEGLDPVQIVTETIWTDGVQTFTGVPLARLIEAVDAEGAMLSAKAINDYAVEIPRSDWVEDGPILAYLNNGTPMSVRDKGPLWVIYPYDDNPDYQTEVVYSRSIWQLNRIEVTD
ncbi:hypothetical protein SAMN04490244_104323 [Tranquillimonas rosea]|uniref:Oxidoreductase molybdopterin-binding domain-containing protein n=1 Tax=Tranquillimonas rosea TaxID=641238 RepID=A0A1H9TR59_9RHOB|nr:oxidoreductase [Tranquillimonas rosea]SER99507.1 hypothetical protein SAMN04490244_104323 [Tranquillimonas rosea]